MKFQFNPFHNFHILRQKMNMSTNKSTLPYRTSSFICKNSAHISSYRISKSFQEIKIPVNLICLDKALVINYYYDLRDENTRS